MLYFEQASTEAWLAAVDGNRAVVVDLASSPGDIPALWRSLHAESGVRGVLDHLTAQGLSLAPGFILLEWDGQWETGASVRVIVRGAASVTLHAGGETTTISGAHVSTWTEQHFDVVSSFELCVGEDPGRGGIALPLAVGAAWTSRLSSNYFEVAQDAGATPARPAVRPAPLAEPSLPPLVQPLAPVGRFSEQTIVEMPVEEVVDATVSSFSSAGEAGSNHNDEVDDATVIVRGRRAEKPENPAREGGAFASEVGDHDGYTVMSGELRKLREHGAQGDPIGEESEPVAAPPAPPVQLRPKLHLPSGEIVGLDEPVLIGRAPSVSQVSGTAVPRLVSLGGVDQDISRNHVQVTVEGDTVVVTDLHSRNGTLIVLPGKSPQKLRSGEPTAVIVGTLIDLGSGIGIIVGEA